MSGWVGGWVGGVGLVVVGRGTKLVHVQSRQAKASQFCVCSLNLSPKKVPSPESQKSERVGG